MKQNTTSVKTGYKSENVVGEGLLYCLVNSEKFVDIPFALLNYNACYVHLFINIM